MQLNTAQKCVKRVRSAKESGNSRLSSGRIIIRPLFNLELSYQIWHGHPCHLFYSHTRYGITSYFQSRFMEVRKNGQNDASDGFGSNFWRTVYARGTKFTQLSGTVSLTNLPHMTSHYCLLSVGCKVQLNTAQKRIKLVWPASRCITRSRFDARSHTEFDLISNEIVKLSGAAFCLTSPFAFCQLSQGPFAGVGRHKVSGLNILRTG